MSKNGQTFVIYLLSTYIIPNYSSGCSNPDKSLDLLKVTVCFISSPVAIISGRESEDER